MLRDNFLVWRETGNLRVVVAKPVETDVRVWLGGPGRGGEAGPGPRQVSAMNGSLVDVGRSRGARLWELVCCVWFASAGPAAGGGFPAPVPGDATQTTVGSGEELEAGYNGFDRGTFRAGFGAGLAYGPPMFGTNEPHDLLLGALQLGWMPTGVIGEDRFYRGNFEIGVEILGALQYHPDGAHLAALTPVLRYSFATGSPWRPFIEAGVGVAVTDIGAPDLSTDFEFRSAGGLGVNYLLSERLAVGFTTRLSHFSNGGIRYPNNGVNEVEFLLGITHWF